jgi:hypothetical protein
MHQVGSGPAIKRLTSSVVAMLERDKVSVDFLTNHEGVGGKVGSRAGPLTTQVEEDRTTFFVPEGVVHPVALLIGFGVALSLVGAVVNQVGKCKLVFVVVELGGQERGVSLLGGSN